MKQRRVTAYLFYLLGIIVSSFGTILNKRAALGMAPWSAANLNLNALLGGTLGTASAFHTTILLLALLLISRNLKSLFTLITIVLSSLIMDVIDLWLLKDFAISGLPFQIVGYFAGYLLITIGSALVVTTKIPAFILEQLSLAIMKAIREPSFAKVRTFLNFVALVLATIYGFSAGIGFGSLTLGTLFMGLTNGPVIGFEVKLFEKLLAKR